MSWDGPDIYCVKNTVTFRMHKLALFSHKLRRIFECFQTVFHSCSENVGTSFVPPEYFYSGLFWRLLYKVVTAERWWFTLPSLPIKMIQAPSLPVLCPSWPDQTWGWEQLGLSLWREFMPFIPGFPLDKPFLICLPTGRTDFGLGCCTARGQKGTRYTRSTQWWQPPLVAPCQQDAGVFAHESAHSGSVPQ